MSKICEYCKLNKLIPDVQAGKAFIDIRAVTATFIYYFEKTNLFALASEEVDVDYGIIHGCEPPVTNRTAVTIEYCPWCGRKLDEKGY